ncbi:MAG: TetR/AcrR family transcriptional regulator [Erysipelotrichaceae bacterium]
MVIKDITDEAGFSRPTFYNYFYDKYHIFEYIIEEKLLKPINQLNN